VSVLELSTVSKFYGSVRAVEDVDLIVPAAGRAAIVGPSGSDKTTLLRLIAGFEQPSAGSILLDHSRNGRSFCPSIATFS
jgi:iron(III) transport system ATP-binding protein